MVLIAPLDLQTLFVSIFAGSSMLFVIIALVMVLFGASKFRMPLIVTGVMIILFSIIIIPIAAWLYPVILIITGLLVGYTITRFQR
jgi:hypothetical protein